MTDVFRSARRELTEAQREHIGDVKSDAQRLYEVFSEVDNREMRIAKTRLEEAVMWAVKGISG